MIIHEIDGASTWVEVMRNRTEGEIIEARRRSLLRMKQQGITPARVNPIRIESCKSFTRAKAFMSECVAITDDLSGSRIIKCE